MPRIIFYNLLRTINHLVIPYQSLKDEVAEKTYQSLTKYVGTPTPIPHSNVGLCNVAQLLAHSVSGCKQSRQQSYALIIACYATLKRGRGEVTKYFDASSEEKAVNDQGFDTDCCFKKSGG